jgi:hypothetical protein
MIEELKATLPNFPEEILEEWLMPYAKSEGWPPFGNDGFPFGPRWPYLLGKKPLSYWVGLGWSEERVHVEPDSLTPRCQDSIAQIMSAAVMGERNLYSESIPDLVPRFKGILAYVEQNKELPKPPALIRVADGLKVVDGSHRMAVYFAMRIFSRESGRADLDIPPQRFWMAE